MRKVERGKAIIISVHQVQGQTPRLGTDVDRDKLKALFTQLHFDVTVFNDGDGLSAQVFTHNAVSLLTFNACF